jgi:hypothetical protein
MMSNNRPIQRFRVPKQTMIDDKTNEDFNKKAPDSEDPNEETQTPASDATPTDNIADDWSDKTTK